MSADEKLQKLSQLHGVLSEFQDLYGERHVTGPETMRAMLRALGVGADTATEVEEALAEHLAEDAAHALPEEIIAQSDQPFMLALQSPCDWTLIDEDEEIAAEGAAQGMLTLPALAVGYYTLETVTDGMRQQTRVLIRPPHAPRPDQKAWGMTGAIFGLRSEDNGGLGNYDDLGRVAAILGAKGAQFFGINPVHALGWAREDVVSPYSPSHRGFFNIDHIAIEDGLGPTPKDTLIDHAAFRAPHRAALVRAFGTGSDMESFRAWRETATPELEQFAQFEAISERYGPDFATWPEELRAPGPKAKRAAGKRADFHAWLQWRAETQLREAQTQARETGMAHGLYLDLAVGSRPEGAEVWMNAETIARGITIGAPPDQLSPEGQSWALSAHAPGRLARAFYGPLRMMLRKLMAICGIIRIDHVLGLMRSYWIPDDGSPGGYISQPLASLLAVITIEADRAGCVVVGEDLGLVPDGLRDRLRSAGLLSYAVWQFEGQDDGTLDAPETLARNALACFSTHDTPTLSGFWYGIDIDLWHRVGWIDGAERLRRHAHRAAQRTSLRDRCAIPTNATMEAVADSIHASLASAPSALVSVQLDDALGVTQTQNLPGTVDEYPNWRRRLPVPVEVLADDPALRRVADLMSSARPADPKADTEDRKANS